MKRDYSKASRQLLEEIAAYLVQGGVDSKGLLLRLDKETLIMTRADYDQAIGDLMREQILPRFTVDSVHIVQESAAVLRKLVNDSREAK